MNTWDSIPMDDGTMLNTLDCTDSYIRTEVFNYFESLLVKLAFRRWLLKEDLQLLSYEPEEIEGELSDDWEIVGGSTEKEP